MLENICFLRFQFKKEKIYGKNLLPLRGNTGIPVKNWDKIIGKKSKYNFKKYELIKIN